MSVNDNKKVFKVKLDSKEVELCVIRPNVKQRQEGQKTYNKAFRDAVESGAILRAKVNTVMRDQNLWDDNKEAQYKKLVEKINSNERKIKSGGIKLSEAKDLALQMRKDRSELRTLTSERSSLDSNTAEGQADNAQFNYWVSACTVYSDTGKTYYASYEDYLNRDDDPVTSPAASNLALMLYNLDPDYEKKLPENEFLKKYNFVDQDLNLVNKNGHRVDSEGRLVASESDYERTVRERLGVHVDSVKFMGLISNQKKIQTLLSSCVGVVNPSGQTEVMSSSALEMQSLGIPIVSKRKNGMV